MARILEAVARRLGLSFRPFLVIWPLVYEAVQAHVWLGTNEFPNMEGLMQLRPLQDRVLIRRVKEDEKTGGGIIIPETARDKPMEGEVVAVGPGARSDDGKVYPLDVRVGDRVLFGKWSGSEIKLEGEDLMVMMEADLMGVVEKPASKRAG